MAMILDAFMKKCITVLTDLAQKEVMMLLGVTGELQKLQRTMESIQKPLKVAERRKFDDPNIGHWLSQLKDVMYDADDIFDLCMIEGPQLLADQSSISQPSPVCNILSSVFHCFTSVPLRHEIGIKIKELNDRLNQIYEDRQKFKLDNSEIVETSQITLVNTRQTFSMVDPLVVRREVDVAANELVNRLIAEKVETKCRLFAVVGMGGIGKTTLAQQIFNHSKIKTSFNLKAWVCVSQTYSEIELLKLVIRQAKGNYGDANTKSELQPILTQAVVSGESLFLVLDDVWRADVWDDLLRVPLQNAKRSVRVLVTTRDENVADDMKARIHHVEKLSISSGWDMLCKLIFSEGQEELANELKDLGYMIVERCKCLPLAIKLIHTVLKRPCTRKAWEKVLRNHAWSISNLPKQFRGSLYFNFEDLPSSLKQCFLYFSLYPEDYYLFREHVTKLWVAEGFLKEEQDLLMEDLAENYFNDLVRRSFLTPGPAESDAAWSIFKMHDIIRALTLFLSKEETSCGDVNVESSTTSIKLRRLSVAGKNQTATEILDSVADLRALRTLIASDSNLLFNEERLRQLSCLRVLDISATQISILPDSIGNLVHLRYLDLSSTDITAIPESIENLAYLQFLIIEQCQNLTHLPIGITRLRNLRYLNILGTPLNIIPKGIEKLQQLNHLNGFVVINNDSSCKLEELSTLKQIRILSIFNLERAQSEADILTELPYLSELRLYMSTYHSEPTMEEQLAVKKLFDKLTPPRSLEKLEIVGFRGYHLPNWMGLSSFEICVPYLTKLVLLEITSCTQLPPLGQLPELRELTISDAGEVKKIGPEFLGGGVKSTVNSLTWIAFPKLEQFIIKNMPVLDEWCFVAEVEPNASPKLKLLPCLQKLEIIHCPLLKQLPRGLMHSTLKSVCIKFCNGLESLENLPQVIEEVKLIHCKNLKHICRLPALKYLAILFCEALSRVKKLDTLQHLKLHFLARQSLPDWLLLLLQEWVRQNYTDEHFRLELFGPWRALQGILKGGSHWCTIEHIPEVTAYAVKGGGYLRYIKEPYVYDTNL